MEEHPHHHGKQEGRHQDHRSENRDPKKGYRVMFFLMFSGAIMVEALLFMRTQMREVAVLLKEDLRIVVVKSDKLKQDSIGIEDQLRALPGTKEVIFISKAERLRKLKEDDPDLVGSVMNIGANPLPDTFEVELEESVIGDINSWIEAAWKITGVEDIKYKPLEIYAILHAMFYGHYILMALVLPACGLVLMVVMALFYKNPFQNLIENVNRDRNWFFVGALASAVAVALSYALVYPVKYLSPLWLWPSSVWQIAIIAAGGILAWVIFQWKNTH